MSPLDHGVTAPGVGDTRGGGRFRLIAPLGAGAMGAVWDALDVDDGGRVALKTMPFVDGHALWAFKREFRISRDLRHVGLVAMHELVHDDAGWFFTMERVQGVGFVIHAAPGVERTTQADSLDAPPVCVAIAPDASAPATGGPSPPLDAPRVRDALRRLFEALASLHGAGLVHRDIKPSNVLVEPDGRVVVLDFGLAIHALRSGRGGTRPYMAPEQHRGAPLTGAADVYAAGVMLHEILTGVVPFRDDATAALLAAKERAETPLLAGLAALDALDGELVALCRRMLVAAPDARPTALAALAALGPSTPGPIRAARPGMIGRAVELAELDQHRRAVSERGTMRVVAVVGEAGIGKTTLVEHALAPAAAGGALVLSARCSERERVPFRAVDGLVDDLVPWLDALPAGEREALLGGEVALVGAAFPVLRSRAVPPVVAEPRERRERLFAAFRTLLHAVAAQVPTVIWLDDTQWADDDSIAMLGVGLRAPPPPILVVATTRNTPPLWLPGPVASIALTSLSASDATALARAFAPEGDVAHLVRAAGGHPLYLAELAVAEVGAAGTLAELLRAQIAALPADRRVVLERLAIAGGPVRREVLAAAIPDGVELGATLASLRRLRLVASAPDRGAVAFDVFHARVRDAVTDAIAPAHRRGHHAALAAALEALDRGRVDALATHWDGAGEPGRAWPHALAAAAAADDALAFESAARWYARAIAMGERAAVDHERLGRMRGTLGGALANLGRGADAAGAFEQAAAAERDPAAAAELRRRAAEQLLLSGHIERGLALLHAELRAVGLRPPPSGRAALFALARARLAARRVDLDAALAARRADALTLRRIDTAWAVAQGLVLVDTFAGAVAQSAHLPLAVSAGEPYRAARALALEASYLAPMRGGAARADRALAAAHRAAGDDQRARAVVALAESVGAYFRGRYAAGLELGAVAENALVTHCVGAVWELGVARHHMLLDLVYMGEMAEARRRLDVLLVDARTRGDRYAETYLRTGVAPFCALVADDPAGCRAGTLAALAGWDQPRWVVQIYAAMMAVVQSHVYEGDGDAAARELSARWPALARSLLLGVSLVRVESWRLRARTALTRAAATRGLRRTGHALGAARAIRVMAAEPGVPAQPFSILSRAGLAHVRGDLDDARTLLERAAAAFDAADMRLMAACARRCHGILVGGTAGATEVTAADAWMRAQTIVDPVRMTACLAPGFG